MKNKTTLIIPTLNRPESLRRTLECYRESTCLPDQIILVDQSDDPKIKKNNKDILESVFDQKQSLYIELEEKSLTLARNTGLSQALNDTIIFSDDDVDVKKDTIKNIIEIMDDQNVSMIGGLNSRGTSRHPIQSLFGYFFLTKSFVKRKKGYVTKSMFGRYPQNVTEETTTEWAMGYFFVIRKKLTNEWNLKFDTSLIKYAYPEDLDFTFSYYKNSEHHGYRCILTPKVKVLHRSSTEYRIPSFEATYYYVNNRRYLVKKHHFGLFGILACEWSNVGHLLLRTIKQQAPMDFLKSMFLPQKYKMVHYNAKKKTPKHH